MAESMMGLKRTHRCTEVTTADIGREVTVMGWIQKSRNKGGIIFVDLRDRSGILQIIFEESDCGAENFAKAEKLRSEFVVAVTGRVEARSGAVNENLATGAIEVRAHSMRVLAESETPPFPIEENSKTKEELRLKYRFLDLRRPDLQRNLITRSRVATLTRAFLAEEGFLEIETPTLIKSTPEGARDYLVPSRVHPGSFYALPQSPQLFKQLLMCSGYDRYFQLARCYRDEDLRADRQPEFTQIDMELSFVDVDDVLDVNERLLQKLFKEICNFDVQLPIQRMTWREAMDRYGSDKPDLRFGMELKNVSQVVKDCEFVGNHNYGRIIPGKTRDEVLHLRFLAAGILHQLQDLGNRGIIKFLCNLHPEQPASIDTAADDIITHSGLPWNRFTGKGRGVHHGITEYHLAVQGNPLPGFNHDDIAHLYVIRVHLLKLSVLLNVGVFRTDIHKLRDGLPGTVYCITLEQFAYLVKQHDCNCL